MNYSFGKKYKIRPFGLPGKEGEYEAKFVGYIERNMRSDGVESDLKIPVFKFNFYKFGNHVCLMALHNGRCLCHGHDPQELMGDFKNQFGFVGTEHEKISVGIKTMDREEFIKQSEEARMPREHIEKCLMTGSFRRYQNYTGEIKMCPTCEKIRQTTCSVCGCGNCTVCGHRWRCYAHT